MLVCPSVHFLLFISRLGRNDPLESCSGVGVTRRAPRSSAGRRGARPR